MQVDGKLFMFHIWKSLGKIPAVEDTADSVFNFLFVSKYFKPVGVCIAFGHCHVVPRLDFKAEWSLLVWFMW